MSEAKAPHFSRVAIAWVGSGGMIGTCARYLIGAAAPTVSGIPVATWGINVVGAFLLGLLLEGLALWGEDAGRRRNIRLFAGTGVLGGFTTYSTLATDTVSMIASRPVVAVGYALGTVVVGAVASLAGIVVARRVSRLTGNGGAR